jgi:hypothetical protein
VHKAVGKWVSFLQGSVNEFGFCLIFNQHSLKGNNDQAQ